ncbi:sigma-70 family RNA polymerase sigma factor [Flavobacteriaceae bacterium R38]|nr:sigma-70 family RNA polymerase sigma factor [Flavobacteriaceae bacterium R38]
MNKEEYFAEVYEQNKDKIYRLCLGFMGNTFDADDLLQEILIKIWSNLSSFKGNSSISTWIYRIATNTAILYSKRRNKLDNKHTRLTSHNEIIASSEVDSSKPEREINKLYIAISSLKEIDRIVIGLLLEGNSYNEIANITGLKISNVGVRINRIKKALNKKLKA